MGLPFTGRSRICVVGVRRLALASWSSDIPLNRKFRKAPSVYAARVPNPKFVGSNFGSCITLACVTPKRLVRRDSVSVRSIAMRVRIDSVVVRTTTNTWHWRYCSLGLGSKNLHQERQTRSSAEDQHRHRHSSGVRRCQLATEMSQEKTRRDDAGKGGRGKSPQR